MTPAQINVASFNISLATPEIFLLAAVSAIMVAHLFWASQHQEGRLLLSSLVTLLITTILVVLKAMPAATGSVIEVATVAPIQYGFSNMFVVDGMATLLKVAMLMATAVVIIYSRAYLSEIGRAHV